MANKYDFDDNDKGGFSGMWETMGPRVTVGAVTLAVVILAGVIWATYPGEDAMAPGDSVPIVRADAGEFKTAPDDPGGMQIAHRDSTVFGAGTTEEPVENLLADDSTEEPLPKSELFAGLNTGEPSGEIADSVPPGTPAPDSAQANVPPATPGEQADEAKTASIEEKVLNETAPAAGDLTPPTTPAPAAPAKEVDMTQAARVAAQLEPTAGPATTAATAAKTPSKEAQKAAKVEPAAGAGAGNFYIQVGSVKEESKAAAEWKKIQAKHSGQLSNLTHRVERADLGAKGVFYRIQAGPVSKENANVACDAIKKTTPGGCLIVAD